jgi:hypothetical protein
MFYGLAGEFKRVDDLFQSVWDGTNILTTNDVNYMSLWEGAVGYLMIVLLKLHRFL